MFGLYGKGREAGRKAGLAEGIVQGRAAGYRAGYGDGYLAGLEDALAILREDLREFKGGMKFDKGRIKGNAEKAG